MKPEYPKDLQTRFEQAIAQGRYAKGTVLSLGDLAAQFQAPVDEMSLVALTGYRKGLLDQVKDKPYHFRK